MEAGERLSGLFRKKEDFQKWVEGWCAEGIDSDVYRWELFVSLQDRLEEQRAVVEAIAKRYMRERALLDQMSKVRISLIDFYVKSADFKKKLGAKT